jgi:heme/copper-type cytochrome/quinol oxidase subunit 4
VGFIAIAQALINYKALKTNISIITATIVCAISYIAVMLIYVLNNRIVKKSKDYSEYHMKFILLVTVITIPIMFFGLIWILSTKGIVM